MAIKDRVILEAALIGLAQQRTEIDKTIQEIREQLGQVVSTAKPQVTTSAPRKKRTMSAAARKRIGDAQKKRWAAYHKGKG